MDSAILINAFEVPPAKDDEFMARWQDAAAFLRQQEGFISTRLHQSLDPAAFRFVDVAVWQSPEHFRQAVGTAEFQALARRMPFVSHPTVYRSISE